MSSPTRTYTVAGMTCAHCASSVTSEVAKVPGVVDVNVELSTGALRISTDRPVDDAAVKGAVEEAGYELVSP